jgi:hypothetical protein
MMELIDIEKIVVKDIEAINIILILISILIPKKAINMIDIEIEIEMMIEIEIEKDIRE